MAELLCKYYKKQRYVSYNDGVTWQPLDEYEKGELYETHSASCGAGTFQYRWVLVNNGYICDGKDRYSREIYQYSEDGIVWYNVFPTQYRKGYLIESNSPFCDNAGNGQYIDDGTNPTGNTPCPPNYTWNGSECVCNGHEYNGNCIVCRNGQVWSGTECVCTGGTVWNGYSCERPNSGRPNSGSGVRPEIGNGVVLYYDPLKVIKCSTSNGVITSADTSYYSTGWSIISYEIGDCIYRIDDGAFNGQTHMSAITIPSTVVEIGDWAFSNCYSLPTISIPTSALTELGEGAFSNCSSLTGVTFGGSIPSALSDSLFANCIKLQSVPWVTTYNITSIGNKAFYNCYGLTGVTFPQSLTSIGASAFTCNYSLGNIEIPTGVTSIGANAFEKCSGLTNVRIDSDEVTIGANVFKGCTSLTALTIDSSGVTIGDNVFSGCTRLLKLTFTSPTPFTIEEGDFDNTNECAIFVPCNSVDAYKTAWPQYAHRIQCNDTGIYYRWVDADGIYCDGTDEYTMQKQQQTTNGITWTDNGVYRPITLITHYSKSCGYQGDVVLTVTNEDGYTRYYEPCDGEEPQPSENSKFFAQYSYGLTYDMECDSSSILTSGNVRSNTDTRSPYTSITKAIVGDCVTSIAARAFYNCNSLTSVAIPNSVTSIGDYAFSGCSSLASVIIPNSVASVGREVFCSCSSLTSVTIPNSVTSIGDYAFSGCSSLASVAISNSVTSIDYYAFYNCNSLTSVTIGSGITSIGARAFSNCSSLASVTVNAITPPDLEVYAFYGSNCPIYVPRESVNAYKENGPWSFYEDRIQPIPN